MARLRAFLKGICVFALIVLCFAVWVLHSLYFILRYHEVSERRDITKVQSDHQVYPKLVICNRLPFSQAGLRSSPLNDNATIRYLEEWLNPSLSDQADFVPLEGAAMYQAKQLMTQYLATGMTQERITRLLYQCQDLINSCRFGGRLYSSFECCQMMRMNVGTLHGICMVFQNPTLQQTSYNPQDRLELTFQISRNSYAANQLTTHPGIDIYLYSPFSNSDIRMATELPPPILLSDKRGVRLNIHREVRSDIRRRECGQGTVDAQNADRWTEDHGQGHFAECVLTSIMANCRCVPTFVKFDGIDQRLSDFYRVVNLTQECTIEQYSNCSKPYMDYVNPKRWNEAVVGRDERLKTAIDKCRQENRLPCQLMDYPGTMDDYPLPAEYSSTPDFVSRLAVSFDSLATTEVVLSREPNLYELLSYIGYNFALWFCMGFAIWLIISKATSLCCPRRRRVHTEDSDDRLFVRSSTRCTPVEEISDPNKVEEQPVD
ncbi:hypothetical protein QR680_010943 [Steinernema hermaphroditum]|uniref:Uncharacterized protein n=1 Tax=Steinernema hermaphroditum TaxID=289476 RepID=A0AA39ISD8_9BILA|nr:hypothetical protein QR680_010943 [Steinernema hermaphroditum]